MVDAIVFGLIDNAVLLLGCATGLEVERMLPASLRGAGTKGAIIGAGIGNAVSDGLAGFAVSPSFAVGVTLGCVLALVALPIVCRRATAVVR